MKRLLLTCKKATYLISLKEENKLSFRQSMQLRAHLTVCSFCKLFQKQTRFIVHNAKLSNEHIHAELSVESKGEIQKNLNAIIGIR